MNNPPSYTSEQLATALHSLGVEFVMGNRPGKGSLYKKPTSLITALAKSPEARLRLSLIPLFLEHPEMARYVPKVVNKLEAAAKLTIKCYYTAAVWLQKQNYNQLDALIKLKSPLPDYFSIDLGLEITTDFEENLRSLAQRHQLLSNSHVNWLGTYQHALKVWLKGLELQRGV